MKNIVFLALALCVGGLLPVQGSINAYLGKSLNHPLQATFISFFGAILFLFCGDDPGDEGCRLRIGFRGNVFIHKTICLHDAEAFLFTDSNLDVVV